MVVKWGEGRIQIYMYIILICEHDKHNTHMDEYSRAHTYHRRVVAGEEEAEANLPGGVRGQRLSLVVGWVVGCHFIIFSNKYIHLFCYIRTQTPGIGLNSVNTHTHTQTYRHIYIHRHIHLHTHIYIHRHTYIYAPPG